MLFEPAFSLEERELPPPDEIVAKQRPAIISTTPASQLKQIEALFKLFDTAGIRRKARVQEKLEKLSVSDGLRAVKFAEVVVLLLDAEIPFEQQPPAGFHAHGLDEDPKANLGNVKGSRELSSLC